MCNLYYRRKIILCVAKKVIRVSKISSTILNLLVNVPIPEPYHSQPIKISENLCFTGLFQGYKIGTMAKNGEYIFSFLQIRQKPVNIYFSNNRNTRQMCKISSKLSLKTPGQHQRRRSDVFIDNFEQS